MRRPNKQKPVLENIEITAAGAEGKAIARIDNKVVFVPFAVPGDVVDIQIIKKKKSYFEGKIREIKVKSPLRIEPRCEHFGLCGGCKWQILSYKQQLVYKQQQVVDNFERLGKLDTSGIKPVIPSPNEYFYRNKLEFTFLFRKWLTENDDQPQNDHDMYGLGFHLPGMFDRIIDLQNCYLQPEPSNTIRLAFRQFCLDKKYQFYNNRIHEGFLRNLIVRNTSGGQLMIIVVFARDENNNIKDCLDFLVQNFPAITSLYYVINTKRNDIINDQELILFKGAPFILEEADGLKFKIGPVTFFQTNSRQAFVLYEVARKMAGFTGNETVYDLYCGAGTITNFIAQKVKKVIGIEYIPSAVDDARENSKLNNISNTVFVAGDIANTLTPEFFTKNGHPDVIITDPPRSGMHPKVVDQIGKANPAKIVYISCNPATQARDIAMLGTQYKIKEIQPVDMFPQTHHIENVVLLVRE
mgnify:CR=1 FL=1